MHYHYLKSKKIYILISILFKIYNLNLQYDCLFHVYFSSILVLPAPKFIDLIMLSLSVAVVTRNKSIRKLV